MTDVERRYLEDHGWREHRTSRGAWWRDPITTRSMALGAALYRQLQRDADDAFARDQGGFPKPVPAWSDT